MRNRRTFIKQFVAAGIASSFPSILFTQKEFSQTVRLIVRADDMGDTWDKTLGIIKAHKKGIVTSVSLMPTSQFFEESVQLCKACPSLAVGVHITLLGIRQRPALSPDMIPSIVSPSGFFYESRDELNKANPKAEELEKEIRAQIGKVRASGLHFVYVDCHMGGNDMANELIIKICKEQKLIFGRDYDASMYGYMLLPLTPESWPRQQMLDGKFKYYAAPAFDAEQEQLFYDRLMNIKSGYWISVVHPGLVEPQRASVTELLCAPSTKEIIKMKNIQLVSYYDVWDDEYGKTKLNEKRS